MTVKELIEKLQKLPEDAIVIIQQYGEIDELCDVTEIYAGIIRESTKQERRYNGKYTYDPNGNIKAIELV